MPVVSAPAREAHAWLRRLSWIGVLIGGVIAYLVLLFVLVSTKNLNFFPALLLTGSITAPLAVLVYAEGGGRVLPVPLWSVILTAILGGLVSVVLAGLLEYRARTGLGVLPMILVALIEESAKLVVPVILFLIWRPRQSRGGVVIGVAAGMGFATLETLGYGFQALLSTRSLAAVDSTLLLRGMLSPASHVAWTGMIVAMLWRIPASRHTGRAVWAFVASFVIAVILHASWDGVTFLPIHIAIAVFSFVVLMVFMLLSHRRLAVVPQASTHTPSGSGAIP